ncbi:MAG: energy transducer TonB [Ginsengibacter sp.]
MERKGRRQQSKLKVEASFPGGQSAWNKYITQQIQMHADEFKKKDIGTCIVRFIVDKNGHPQEVEATNMKKSKLARVAIEAIENGPKWIPAHQNGKFLNAYRLQPVTLFAK